LTRNRTPARRRAALALALALTAFWPASASADWPMYGHDVANSRHADDGPARSEVGKLRRVWRFEIQDGAVFGTPTVSGNTLVAAARGGKMFALDARTGRLRWKRDVHHEVHSSIAIAGGRAFIPVSHAGRPFLLAVDLHTGKRLWKSTLDTQRGSDLYSSPVPWGGRVYIGVSALHAEWAQKEPRDRGSVVAVDARTGARVWKTFTVPADRTGGSVWSTPAIDGRTGRLFVGTGNAYQPPVDPATNAVLAFDVDSGARLARHQPVPGDWWNGHHANDPDSGPDADFGASPNLFVDGGRTLVGEAQKSGVYWALDRDTLAERWHAQVAPGSGAGGVVGSTAYDGRRIYGPETVAAHVWALGTDGRVAWDRDEPGYLRYCAVAVSRGVLYGADGAGHLVARRTGDGKRLGRWSLGGRSWGGVSVANGRVFVSRGTTDDHVGAVVAFARP
jgi:polyvinyl alcohol dehydrogenase (cytochrome)